MDECLSECKSDHMKSCINTLGSYKCVCLDGYTVSKQGAIHADDICIGQYHVYVCVYVSVFALHFTSNDKHKLVQNEPNMHASSIQA